jgi:choline-sulfatase
VRSRIVAALVEAVLAAAVVGALEGGRVLADAGGAGGAGATLQAAAVAGGVAGLGAVLAAALLAGALGALGRIPVIAGWRRDLAAGGAARAIAVWRAALAAAAVLATAVGAYAVARWSHEAFRFKASGPTALLVASAVTPLVAGIAAAALELDRRVAARLARGGRVTAALDGRRRWLALALAALAALAAGPPLAVRLAAPEVSREAIAGAAQLAAAVVALRAVGAGRRRGARIAALGALAACAAGLLALPSVEPARGALVVRGVFGRAAAGAAWALADRDGDGYPPAWAGGADCDDADPARHPTAHDVAGNGIDENCTGADAAAAALAPRAAPRPPSFAGPDAPRHDIVLVTIDALRADRLGAYGHARPTSPSIDALAASATRFAWALTPCPATRCAIPALFTGRLPSVADDAAPSLASVLAGAGWQTAAISCCERFSLGGRDARGFGLVDVSPDAARVRRAGHSNADVVADTALHWLAHRGPDARPFLLWLHFYEPHFPYAAPEDPTRFGGGALDRYDAEIAYVDRHVGRVLAALDPRTTIVALTADHGESFGEHGTRYHARSLYNAEVRIPLIVRYPGAPPHVVTGPASLVDVMPTLLDLAGVAGPPGMNGRSLAASVRAGVEPPPRPVLMELVPDNVIRRDVAAIAYGGWKLIWDRQANASRLYSIAGDPAERDDRAAAEPGVLADLRRRLLDALDGELAIPP